MAAANSEYTHSSVNAITSVPMPMASSMFPPGKSPGACSSMKIAPSATFMPRVFMIRASHLETSRTRPVAFRTNSCPPPAKSEGRETSLAMCSSCAIPAAPGTATGYCLDDRDRSPAFDREPEPLGPVEHVRVLNRVIPLVPGDTDDSEHRRARRQPEQLSMLERGPVDLHEVVGCGHFHAVDPAQRLVKRSGAQILVTDTAGVPRRQPRRQQRERLRVDAGKSPQAPGIVTAQGERGIDDMRRPDDITAQHLDVDIEALAAHRLVEAAEDLDLLDQLAVADEAAPAPNALDVALSREVSHGLPDRGQADAQRLGEFSFPGQLPPWLQPTLLHALDHGDLDLVVQRHRAVPANRSRQPRGYLTVRGGRHRPNITKS